MFSLSSLLTIQSTAATLSIIGTLLVVAVVIFVFLNSSQYEEKDEAKKKVYKVRARYFFGLVIVAIALLFVTLRMLPFPHFQDTPQEHISVIAKQWFWEMKHGTPDSQEPAKFGSIDVPVNKTIAFHVTSGDVTHNFGVYSEDGTLVTQVQAMPGYEHELIHKFTIPGEYHILCLEYCGVPHGIMMGKLIVQ